MMKLFGKSKAQQRTIYLLLVVLAIIALAALLNSFNKQQELENQRLEALQQEQLLNQKIDTALSDLESESDAAQATGLHSLTHGRSGLQIATQEQGNAVVVDTVIMERPGFIVIYAGDGAPETILNASPFLVRGVYPFVSVAIPTALKAGTSYYATIHFDGNDDGEFNNEYDLPATGTNGEILSAQFTVQKP